MQECIAAHPEDARHGVSRPQIKKFAPISCNYILSQTQGYFRFVEEKYKLVIGNAQITQLSRAIAVGAEKNIFSLPKGCNYFL
jgi:histone H1/5